MSPVCNSDAMKLNSVCWICWRAGTCTTTPCLQRLRRWAGRGTTEMAPDIADTGFQDLCPVSLQTTSSQSGQVCLLILQMTRVSTFRQPARLQPCLFPSSAAGARAACRLPTGRHSAPGTPGSSPPPKLKRKRATLRRAHFSGLRRLQGAPSSRGRLSNVQRSWAESSFLGAPFFYRGLGPKGPGGAASSCHRAAGGSARRFGP